MVDFCLESKSFFIRLILGSVQKRYLIMLSGQITPSGDINTWGNPFIVWWIAFRKSRQFVRILQNDIRKKNRSTSLLNVKCDCAIYFQNTVEITNSPYVCFRNWMLRSWCVLNYWKFARRVSRFEAFAWFYFSAEFHPPNIWIIRKLRAILEAMCVCIVKHVRLPCCKKNQTNKYLLTES